MHCPHCQQENPAAAKFCLACGQRLRGACAHCGTELPAHARFCTECGSPTAPPGARVAEEPATRHVAWPDTAELAPAATTRIVLERRDVLQALYQQGMSALRRGDSAAALAALTPVVAEAGDTYPDASPALQGARLARARDAALTAASRWLRPARTLETSLRTRAGRVTATAVSTWLPPARALGERALHSSAGRAAADHASRWLGPARARWRMLPHRASVPVLGLATLAIALLAGGLLLQQGGPVATRAASSLDAAPVPTLEPDADLFARCEAAVAAENWTEAIRACRILHARDPDYAGLADKLAAAYLGRGEQRLAAGNDLAAAEADFQQALAYQPESAEAQRAFQQLSLYQQGDKALGVADWPNAVAQFSAIYAEAPDYLEQLGTRSLEAKLFTAWLAWGQSALNANAERDAADRCAQALALVPDDPDAKACFTTAQSAIANAEGTPQLPPAIQP